MRKIIVTLLSTAALLTVAATPALAIEGGSGPVNLHMDQTEATQFLQARGFLGGSGIKSDLCRYEECGGPSAADYAYAWAVHFWGESERYVTCDGPYGNGKTHGETQWACYGNGSNFSWQVNVDPWGEQTYHVKYPD